jgi:ABC-type lipoprotein export system ATPase subunit
MIVLEDVTKTYLLGEERIVAVNNLCLTVRSGEFVAVMGKSGCGKTTLLSLIGGLDRPDGGRVIVNGQDIAGLGDGELTRYRRDQVGIVFQFFNLIPILTVSENVALPGLLQAQPGQEVVSRVEHILTEMGLWNRRNHYPHEISGGEMQRAAIARALINRPPLILADEPTGNLDSRTGGEILRLLGDLRARHQVTVILATHSMEAAARADRRLTMRDGSLSLPGEVPEATV